jgi:hypothetical protein
LYIYDRQLAGSQHRREEQPITLRPAPRYYYSDSSQLGNGILGEGDPTTKHRVLIFYGFSGSSKSDGYTEADHSNRMVALTLKRHVVLRFPNDEIEVLCAWHKNPFVNALTTPSSTAPKAKIRQVHYVGHGSPGGLWFGYRNKVAVGEREKLFDRFQRAPISLIPTLGKRIIALQQEDGLVSGFFTDALPPSSLAKIKAQLVPEALMHIWGCFAGAAQHTFDPIPYWNLFNAAGTPVDGIARHIAKALEISVTAVYDPSGISGMNYWYRDQAGKLYTNERPARIPQWLWPSAERVRWVTYNAVGNGDEQSIVFLGGIKNSAELKPGRPPTWLINEIPQKVKTLAAGEPCTLFEKLKV